MAENLSIMRYLLDDRLSELYGKDDKEDRDEESGMPGMQGKKKLFAILHGLKDPSQPPP